MSNNELKHYGVLGMRWGVRRTPEQLRKAAGKLEERNRKLQDKHIKTNMKATKLRARKSSIFTSRSKAEKLESKIHRLEERGKDYVAKMMLNDRTQSIYNNTASALESGKVLAGNRFIMKYEKESVTKRIG